MPYLMRSHIHHPVTPVSLFARVGNEGTITLAAVKFGHYTTCDGIKAVLSDNRALHEYAVALNDFLDTTRHDLGSLPLAMDGYTDFQRRVFTVARKIPWGKTVSYKALAEKSGCLQAVRAVAHVIRNNRFPLIIPCHRVIRSDGTIGGFAGQMQGGMVKLKRVLLEREGITVR